MKKKKLFYYDVDSLQYKEVRTTIKSKLYYFIACTSAIVFVSLVLISLLWKYIESPGETIYRAQYDKLSSKYKFVQKKFNQLDRRLYELEKRDNEVYRAIFEAPPIHDSVRNNYISNINYFDQTDNVILNSVEDKIHILESRMTIAQESYEFIEDLVYEKRKLLSATPAIQPVSNKDLSRIASTFGVRTDPFYKVKKFHYGIDFTSPENSHIYVTADGVVEKVEVMGGYGKCVVVNHGYGYKTLYAHMSKFNCKKGQKVKRGSVIGYVGHTGKSTAPHLHYEVIRNNKKVNPINFFYADIDPAQYDLIVNLSKSTNNSLD